MDTGKGDFVRVTEEDVKNLSINYRSRIFEVGEEVKIKDSRFKVMAIGKREMRLRLLPDQV